MIFFASELHDSGSSSFIVNFFVWERKVKLWVVEEETIFLHLYGRDDTLQFATWRQVEEKKCVSFSRIGKRVVAFVLAEPTAFFRRKKGARCVFWENVVWCRHWLFSKSATSAVWCYFVECPLLFSGVLVFFAITTVANSPLFPKFVRAKKKLGKTVPRVWESSRLTWKRQRKRKIEAMRTFLV